MAWLGACACGFAVHALLFALTQHTAQSLLPAPGWFLALASTALVVVGLASLAPGLPWWPSAAPRARELGDALLQTSLLLRRSPGAGRQARRDALWLHATLGAPALGLALALELGGPWWALGAALALPTPWLLRAVAARAQQHADHTRALSPRGEAAEREHTGAGASTARRVLLGLGLTSTLLLAAALAQVGRPAPARAGGSCARDPGTTRVAIPGAIPGTPLRLSVEAQAVALSAADGGGPGRVVLGRDPTSWRSPGGAHDLVATPKYARVRTHGGALHVSLCAGEGRDSRAHQLRLSPEGYRLDDSVAQRVLRSRASEALALLLLVLAVAYARWGWRALGLTYAGHPHAARAARAWAWALGAAQLLWVCCTWAGA